MNKKREIKVKFRNWFINDAKQIALLPHFDVFWESWDVSYYKGTNFCISFGFLMFVMEIWIGKDLEDLI